MSDTYQAVFDAVRSRISNGDIGEAVESAIRDMNLSHYVSMAMNRVEQAASCYDEPSVLYKPKLSIDGNQWCALYGEDLQSGVAGFGDSPGLAIQDFNKNWYVKLPSKVTS